MKTKFHVFFLFSLIFTLAVAANAGQVSLQDDGAGGKYINMPVTGSDTLVLDAATSFKVYDDGGEYGQYSNDANGYLVVIAPEGLSFAVFGTVNTESEYDSLNIYKNEVEEENLILNGAQGENVDVSLSSAERKIILYFHSDYSETRSGFELNVSVGDASTSHMVSLNNVEGGGGTVASDKSEAAFGEEVTLTLTPSGEKLIKGVSVVDGSGNVVKTSEIKWFSDDNTVKFIMPGSDVTVTPVFAEHLTAADGIFINMPVSGTKEITIPAGVTSFKVYDDGGEDGNYGYDADGFLVLNAPPGYLFQISGTVNTEYDDYLDIYEGSENDYSVLLDYGQGIGYDIGTIISTKRAIALYFYSNDYDANSGLDLIVSLVDASTPHTISLNSADGGTVTSNKETAVLGEEVTLTLTPSGNNFIGGVSVVDENGGAVKTSEVKWYSDDRTVTFTMPGSNVTVTPTFVGSITAEGGSYVNMPVNGMKEIAIPAGVTSFKVYDDGDKDGNYSNNVDGYLVLKAPDGYSLKLTGSLITEGCDLLTVYDNFNDYNVLAELSGEMTEFDPVFSPEDSLILHFESDGSVVYSGLELVVSVVKLTPHTVSVASADGGSVSSSDNSATPNKKITLSASPDDGYVLNGITVVGTDDNESIEVSGGKWYSGNTASFVMPDKNVTVTPVFVKPEDVDGDLSINMPTDYFEVQTATIPAGVSSFKIYDDGGADACGSSGVHGYLQLEAPTGTYLQISGNMKKDYKNPPTQSTLVIRDGDSNADVLLNQTKSGQYNVDFGPVLSTGENVYIRYESSLYQTAYTSSYADLVLNVSVLANTQYAVTLESGNGGTASVDKEEAYAGETVTVETDPDGDNLLSAIEVVDANNNVIRVEEGNWYTSNTGTFVMPRSAVTVRPQFVSEFTADGGLYINMPASGETWVNIPANVSSLKVYDDGGKNAGYTGGSNGNLILTAPEGKVFRVTGSGTIAGNEKWSDRLSIYDGEWNDELLSVPGNSQLTDFGTVLSTENTIVIGFGSEGSADGFELTVSIIDPPAPYTITYAESNNGAISGKASAQYWETVTVTATPNSGYLLSGLEVEGAESHSLANVSDIYWYTGNTVTFDMLPENVVVTPIFTNKLTADDGLSITLQANDSRTIDIPAGVQSFKVYSSDAFNYSERGSLTLRVPDGYVLLVEGLQPYEYTGNPLEIYDVSDWGSGCIWGCISYSSTTSVLSKNNAISLNLNTYSYDCDGLDLTVRVIDASTPHSVIIAENITGGSMTSDADEAPFNTEIHLTASPSANYVLDNVTVTDSLGSAVSVVGGKWYSGNQTSFVMPASYATVTPVFTDDLNNLYINKPAYGNLDALIPEGVTSFKVYDDGGADGDFSAKGYGALNLTAPDGYVLQVTGSMAVVTDYACLSFYNGEKTLLKKVCGSGDVGTVISNGKELSIDFVADETGTAAGFDLTVTLVTPTSSHAVVVANADGGTVESDKETAYLGDVVTLTATPSTGNLLKEIVVQDANGAVVNVEGGTWANDNTGTFSMPYSDVTVTPSFTDELTADGGLYVNMPFTGTNVVDIPAGVTSFRVYDDGGLSGYATPGTNGYLELRAPAGYLLRVSGYTYGPPAMYASGNFKLYNGDSTASILCEQNVQFMMMGGSGSWGNVSEVATTGNVLAIRLSANGSEMMGQFVNMNLLVSVVQAQSHTVALADDYDGGTVVLDKSTAKVGDAITMTINPDAGNILKGISIAGSTSQTTTELDEYWYAGNSATFEMPDEDIVVTPLFTSQLTAEGGLYINTPAAGMKQVAVPSGVTSFKVYDNGGKDGNYTPNVEGLIQLTAPEGKVFVVEGGKTTSMYETLALLNGLENEYDPYSFDVSVMQASQYQSGYTEIGPAVSTGNTMTVYFKTGATSMIQPTTYEGIDLKITVSDPPSPHNITVANVTGGTVSVQSTASLGEKVDMEAEPESGYLLDGMTVEDADGNPVTVSEVKWYTGEFASFKMPLSDVVVTPSFTDKLTAEEGLHIDMSTSKTIDASIPSGVTSFKVYDDGGADGDYTTGDQDIILSAPSGYELQLTGTMTASNKSSLSIQASGYGFSSSLYIDSDGEGAETEIEEPITAARLQISFYAADGIDHYSGLDLTVKVVRKTHFAAVSIREEEGQLIADVNGMYDGYTAVSIDRDIPVDTVIFNRNFSVGGYATVTLPFDFNGGNVEGWRQVLEFDGIDEDENKKKIVKMKRAWCDAEKLSVGVSADSAAKLAAICGSLSGDLSANTPYMIEVDEDALVFHGPTTLRQTVTPEVRAGDWVFRGTWSKKEWYDGDEDIGSVYGFAANSADGIAVGDFVKFVEGAWIRPLRAYMIHEPLDNSNARRYARSNGTVARTQEELPDRMEIVIVDPAVDGGEEHTTFIGHINTRTGEIMMERNYDLKGRKLNGKPTARGVYYGKKKLVK